MNVIQLHENRQETLSNGFDRFIRYCQIKNLSPRTVSYYEECYNEFMKFIGSDDLDFRLIDKILIEDYTLYLMKKGIASTSVNTRLRGLKAIMNWLMKRGYIDRFTIELTRQEEVIKDAFTDEEIERLLDKPTIGQCSFSEYRNWVMVNFLLGTGIRASTLINIAIMDLDMMSGYLKTRHNKNRKMQLIPLSSSLLRILNEYIDYRQAESERDLLFPNVYGKALTVNGVRQALVKYGKKKQVYKCNTHRFRHTFAKNWVMAGGDVFRLQKILGHSSMDIVRKYVNIYGKELGKDFDKFSILERFSSHKEQIKMK